MAVRRSTWLLDAMKSRVFPMVLIGAVAAALCVYAGLYVYKSHRYASAFADTRFGDSPEIVSGRFGTPPNTEFPHSSYFMGYTMFPCTAPCDTRLWWHDPTSTFRSQAYYFEFDANRTLIRKTHYEHLDEAYLRWEQRSKEGMKRVLDARLGWSSTEADRFRAAKVVVLVRLLEPPQVDLGDPSWGPLSKFLVMRSWKGPFPAGATITAASTALCLGPSCAVQLIPKQTGQLAVIFSLGDAQPIYPIIYAHGGDEAQVEIAAAEVDSLAALGAQRGGDGARVGESPVTVPQSRR
jgi:hypothetical protein